MHYNYSEYDSSRESETGVGRGTNKWTRQKRLGRINHIKNK